MLPHLGAGASQGLEDAYVLVRLLSHPETNVDNLEVRSHSNRDARILLICSLFPGRASGLLGSQTTPSAERLGRQSTLR